MGTIGMRKTAGPNANETVFDRMPVSKPRAPVSPGFFGASTDKNGTREAFMLDKKTGDLISEISSPALARRGIEHVYTPTGGFRVRARHMPGKDDVRTGLSPQELKPTPDQAYTVASYTGLGTLADEYGGGYNYAMSSYWPKGSNAPSHILYGDTHIPSVVLDHETGHGISAGRYSSEEELMAKDRLQEEIDAHVLGGSIDTELARQALSTYALPYYLRSNPDETAKAIGDHPYLESMFPGKSADSITNTPAQAQSYSNYVSRVFPGEPVSGPDYRRISELAGGLDLNLDDEALAGKRIPMEDAAAAAGLRIGRPVHPIDVGRFKDDVNDLDALNEESFYDERAIDVPGGTPYARALAFYRKNPYAKATLEWLKARAGDAVSADVQGIERYPASTQYWRDKARTLEKKDRRAHESPAQPQ